MIRYTKDHEWIRLEGALATVGISTYAAEQLGDVVYVELPEVGKILAAQDDMAVVESAKAASDVYAPVAGRIIAVNTVLTKEPDLVNESPEGDGWFVQLELTAPGELDALMDGDAYANFLRTMG